jgi:hypothetical protein
VRKYISVLPTLIAALCLLSHAPAKTAAGKTDMARDYRNAPLVVKMMAFNKKKDGKLTKDEVADERLHRMFDVADTNKVGIVSKGELIALAAKLDGKFAAEDFRAFGGPGTWRPSSHPGQLLSPLMPDRLQLTADQRK